MSNVNLKTVLDQLHNSVTAQAKTASTNEAPQRTSSVGAEISNLAAEIRANVNKTASTSATVNNTNAGQPPVQLDQLQKLATDMANVDQAAALKEASLMGAAAMDGFLQRANEYAKTAGQQPQNNYVSPDRQQKIAAAHDMIVKSVSEKHAEYYITNGAMTGFDAIDMLIGQAEKTAEINQYNNKVASENAVAYAQRLHAGLVEMGQQAKVAFENGYGHAHRVMVGLNSRLR